MGQDEDREAARAALSDVLGGVELGTLGNLEHTHLQVLAEAFRRTRDQQVRDLERAIDESLRHVPRVFRPAVRRILGV